VPKAGDVQSSPDEEDPASLRSRTDARKERIAREDSLMELSGALVSSGVAVLGKLDLSESLMDAVRNAQAIRRGPARNRALRLVRSALRNEDFEAIRRKLGGVHGNGTALK
jgi:ribosomal 50S subunit-associated protein YjgA (DUF615 family)